MGTEYMFACDTCKEYIDIGKFIHGNFQGPYSEERDVFTGMFPVYAWLVDHTEHQLIFTSDAHRPEMYLDTIPGWTRIEVSTCR